MARYDDAYDIRHRSVLPGGPHARPMLAGPPLGYGYPSDEDAPQPRLRVTGLAAVPAGA